MYVIALTIMSNQRANLISLSPLLNNRLIFKDLCDHTPTVLVLVHVQYI